jgi:predicted phosphatase
MMVDQLMVVIDQRHIPDIHSIFHYHYIDPFYYRTKNNHDMIHAPNVKQQRQ